MCEDDRGKVESGRHALSRSLVRALVLLLLPLSARADGPLVARDLPLVLGDGRTARVSILRVAAAPDRSEPRPEALAALDSLLAGIDPACVLSGQVVGSAEAGVEGDAGTLGIHRLARERAEAVRDHLAARGLPAERIAAVWDFTLAFRERGALVWLFRLDADECAGGLPRDAQLAGGPAAAGAADRPAGERPAAAADATRGPLVTAEAGRGSTDPADAGVADPPGRPASDPSHRAAPAAEPGTAAGATDHARMADAAGTAGPAVRDGGAVAEADGSAGSGSGPMRRDRDAARPRPVYAAAREDGTAGSSARRGSAAPGVPDPSEPVRAAARSIAEPDATLAEGGKPAGAHGAPVADARGSAAASVSGTVSVGAGSGDAVAGTDRTAATPALRLVFDVNSSFLGSDNVERLRTWLASLPEGRWRAELAVAVGPAEAVRARSRAQAEAYERWLAERRARRVRGQLERRLGPRLLDVHTHFVGDDPSRSVEIRLWPESGDPPGGAARAAGPARG